MATPSRRFLPLIVAGQIPLNGKGRSKCPAVCCVTMDNGTSTSRSGGPEGSQTGPGMRLSAADSKPDHASGKSSH